MMLARSLDIRAGGLMPVSFNKSIAGNLDIWQVMAYLTQESSF